jgi:uncharacterized protein
MSLVYSCVLQAKKMLVNLDAWLEKATAYAASKKCDTGVLLASRLAPDQYPLMRQIQAACDQAKFMAARLSGKTPPVHPDTEQTMEEARARIRSCVGNLDTYKASDFEGAESHLVQLPFFEGKALRGSEFLLELSLPNFYFHTITAYAILRHNGVDLGKADFIGGLNLRDPSS